MVGFSIRLEDELYDVLRKAAYDHRIPMARVVELGIKLAAQELDDKKQEVR